MREMRSSCLLETAHRLVRSTWVAERECRPLPLRLHLGRSTVALIAFGSAAPAERDRRIMGRTTRYELAVSANPADLSSPSPARRPPRWSSSL